MPWLGSEDPCSLLAFCPPFSHQTNRLWNERDFHTKQRIQLNFPHSVPSTASPWCYHRTSHAGCTAPPRLSDPRPHQTQHEGKTNSISHCSVLALSWDIRAHSEAAISSNQIQGFTSAYQLVSLSAFQPDTTQVFPQYEAWQLQDLQVSSWLEHPRTSTDKDLLEFRDHTGWQETFTMDLGGSK